MDINKEVEDKLFEYILKLAEGKRTREQFENYRKYLEQCGPGEVNAVIDRFIETEDDYDFIERVVAQFIRACERGLDSKGPFKTEEQYLALLLEENSRLKKHILIVTKVYKEFVEEYTKNKEVDNKLLLSLKEKLMEYEKIKPHYLKLQNSLFPALEMKTDNMNCLKLMWHIQDRVISDLKELLEIIDNPVFHFNKFNRVYGSMFLNMGKLIYREETILFPLAEEVLSNEEFNQLFADVEVLSTAFNVNLHNFYGGKNMSENLNNSKKRKDELNKIIKALNKSDNHKSVTKEIKKDFKKLLDTLSPEEIAEAEQALIAEGVPVEDVQQLCELHVDAFKDALKGASKRAKSGDEKISGHPIANYREENKELKSQISEFKKAYKRLKKSKDFDAFDEALKNIAIIDVHYTRKENQLFPFLEDVGFTGPSKVMWGKHDEIRETFKKIKLASKDKKVSECISLSKSLIPQLKRMVFMEEKILFPTALRKLPESTWAEIKKGEAEIGYSWIKPENKWTPKVLIENTVNLKPSDSTSESSLIDLSIGKLTASQIDLMLTNLPVDITFVDEHNNVRYFSHGRERIFPRSPGIIGRSVQNCHPPKSVHIVEKIVEDFKSGKRKEAEFWIQMKEAFVYIRYFPLFEGDTYKGIIEVSQEVSHIRSLEGEKRLLDEEK